MPDESYQTRYQLIRFRIYLGALEVADQTLDIKLSGKMAEDAIAKARAIALKLSGMILNLYLNEIYLRLLRKISCLLGGMAMGLGSDLGKRKNRWEEEGGGGVMSAGPGCKAIAILA